MVKPIPTKKLIEVVFNNPKKFVEARLLLGRPLVATHFMYFNGRSFYDEGIDGEDRKLPVEEFLGYYRKNYWIVDNVV